MTAHRSPSVALRGAVGDEKSKTHEERPLLAFDTSAKHCAAALLAGDRVILRHEAMEKGQAERLLPMLEDLLAEAGVAWADVGLIVVGTGPGNFTGIRISVALARGLALGLGVPAVGVTGFEILGDDATLSIPASRGQVYLKRPGQAPVIADAEPPFAVRLADLDVPTFLIRLAQAGLAKAATPQPRPAPFYLRGADAAPPSDPPAVILP